MDAMNYLTVKEIEDLYRIEHVLKDLRLLWYKFAEEFVGIPSSYDDYKLLVNALENKYFSGWKLIISDNGSLSLIRNVESVRLLIGIDWNGKWTYQIILLG